MKDWNFGLFVQEIFKQELEEKDDCIKKVMDELDEDLESCDAKSFESAVSSAFPDLNEGKLETIVHGTFDQNLNKIISRVEVKRKLLFLDLVGLCKWVFESITKAEFEDNTGMQLLFHWQQVNTFELLVLHMFDTS